MNKYQEFIASKQQLCKPSGFEAVWLPDNAFDFQQKIITDSLNQGRAGIFADTGLGKTLIQLTIAQNVVLAKT